MFANIQGEVHPGTKFNRQLKLHNRLINFQMQIIFLFFKLINLIDKEFI